ncbi:hypothetical protein HZA38_03630 [Candidatus Peregrinibacteria bacterium]|nr:hypothetical protein [Candidatus Peregrinibacteria bacterium]
MAKAAASKKNTKIQKVEGDSRFFCCDGNVFCTTEELYNALLVMPDDVFSHHSNSEKCDFASWVADVFSKKQAATKMRKASASKEKMQIIVGEIIK